MLLLLAITGCAPDDDPILGASSTGGTTAAGGATAAGGSSNQGGVAGSTNGGAAGGDTAVAEYLIDDFEDGDTTPLIAGGWYYYTDQPNGGGSTLTIPDDPDATKESFTMTGAGYQSKVSLSVAYSFDQGTLTYDPYVGIGAWIGEATAPLDVSAYGGIKYVYKGGAHSVRLETFDVTDFDHFQVKVDAATDWTPITLPFGRFTQEGWGAAVDFDLKQVGNISFQMRGPTGDEGTIQIDNLAFYGTPAPKVKDLALSEPAPPIKTVLPSLAITNPLQAKAAKYLNRGYNITNWLEQGKFDGTFVSGAFTYDKTFVANLAAAGFEGLRLPIDLDLYVEATGTVDAKLFTVLDSFNTWTQEYGLSLTIDYHQYDKSISLSNKASLDLAVMAWGKVAEHFASNTRQDLFFELLNEPELSMGVNSVPKADWTALAERMIAAIRAHDTSHTLLFGDVQWYGIKELAARQPLTDTNVIYVFHDYDPFIFTHQGTSWTGMAATHDVPYPYDVARWSEYSVDLGFNAGMDSWILGAVKSYYQTGSYNALFNAVAVAKKWAVTHNVPIICNEFGAYNGRATLEDRVRYYEDIIGVFEELEIPWQHWFMIVGSDGKVSPAEYKAPFGLKG